MEYVYASILILIGATLPLQWVIWVSLVLAGFTLLLFIIRFHYAATFLFLFGIGVALMWVGKLSGWLHALTSGL